MSLAPPRRILIATLGSLGDLHPYLAIGGELVARGHRVVLASHPGYEERTRAEGLGFVALPPDPAELGDVGEVMARAMNGLDGSRFVMEEFVTPYLAPVHAALDRAAADLGADVLIGHPLTFTVSSLAEKRGIPWVSTALQPAVMFSGRDPSVMPALPWLAPLARRFPFVHRALLAGMARLTRRWLAPLEAIRAAEGLPPLRARGAFALMHSPHAHLALFSPLLAAPQADWPPRTIQCGFPFHDRDEADRPSPPGLEEFLPAGDPPLVFTLGSSAVHRAGDFYSVSLRAAARLGRRALLLVGRETRTRLPDPLPPGALAHDYVPYSSVLPRAAAVVHQGGAGTTGQAMRAGRPMLVVPFAHDQPDHAARVTRLGVGLALARRRYDERRAVAALARLLDEPAFAARAAEVGAAIRAERGTAAAADAIEAVTAAAGSPGPAPRSGARSRSSRRAP